MVFAWAAGDADEHGGLAGLAHLGVVIPAPPSTNVGDVLEADDRVVLLRMGRRLKLGDGVQVGVGRHVHLHQGALGVTDGGQVVVGRQAWRPGPGDVQRRHAVGLEQMRMGKGAGCRSSRSAARRSRAASPRFPPDEVIGDFALRQMFELKPR